MILIYTTDAGTEASILFDATLSVDHVAEADVPEHPVEDGVNVSDHVRAKLDVLSAKVHVTNTPIRVPSNDSGLADPTIDGPNGLVFNASNQEMFTITHNRILSRAVAAPGASLTVRVGFDEVSARVGLNAFIVPAQIAPVTLTVAVVTHKPGNEIERVRAVYNALVQHRARGTIFSVLTKLRDYDNMILTRVGAPESIEDGDAVTISLEMREVRFAAVEIGDPLAPQPREPRGSTEQNRGAQQGQEGDENADAANRSWLRSITDAL
jgi:hypothetical protein